MLPFLHSLHEIIPVQMTDTTLQTASYLTGTWHYNDDAGRCLYHAINGQPVATVATATVDFAQVLHYGRSVGGSALRQLSIHERGRRLKQLAKHLLAKKDEFYRVSACTGATRNDSWIDIEGGIATLFSYSASARRDFPEQPFATEDAAFPLAQDNSFAGRHLLLPKTGVAVHINAFNFPCWGMLEKIAPCLVAGMPVLVKPATESAYLTEIMVREIIASKILPEGSVQLLCGRVGDLLEHLSEQDVVTFTGSNATGQMLRSHPNILQRNIPFNMETDSLNAAILGETVTENDTEFDLFADEVCREMTVKAGQKCTAIRRIIVPQKLLSPLREALLERLHKIVIGDPQVTSVTMGALIGKQQKDEVHNCVQQLRQYCEVLLGGDSENFELAGTNTVPDAFYPPTVLHCSDPLNATPVHQIEAFGPVSTLMPYSSLAEAAQIATLGCGSLVATLCSNDPDEVRQLISGCGSWHGRLLLLNRECATTSTGHGSPLPTLTHGGPGRAGGGEELGGSRAVKHYMQRVAIQGSPGMLTQVSREYVAGARQNFDSQHPFRKYFEELQPGDSVRTHSRTITEADIVNFGCISGDHFYAHFDQPAAEKTLFGQRVAHGYFLISAAAGMFVDPAPGPVLANYGLENLRFIQPVVIGDTLHVRLTVKQKIKKDKRPEEQKATGVVVWYVEIFNQKEEAVALYDILTLVERKEDTGSQMENNMVSR